MLLQLPQKTPATADFTNNFPAIVSPVKHGGSKQAIIGRKNQ
jgi:hypothetical protein